MKIKPTTEQWRSLTGVERFSFRLVNYFNQTPLWRRFITNLTKTFGAWWIELFDSDIVAEYGFENFQQIDTNRGVLLAANHRSFADQFAISARLYRKYDLDRNIFYPVRSNFFYTNLLGLLVNLKISLAMMYPPLKRERRSLAWNQFAMDLMVELLKDPNNMIGFHPEGSRNQGSDPYKLLPAKPGCGELIYRANPNVVPVFLHGFPTSTADFIKKKKMSRQTGRSLVHMVMGEPMDFREELQLEATRKTYLLISKKVLATIQDLAFQEQEIRAQFKRRPLLQA